MTNDRFVNSSLSELQDANRSPIWGYEDAPLLTLEEAVEKIVPPIPRLMDYVTTAKKKYIRHSPLLTRDESAAIYLYSMPSSFFSRLNETLRAEDRHALKPWFAFLKLFMAALEKLPSTEATVWRGVTGDVGSVFADNDVHIWWSVNSCSMALDIVQPFLGDKGTLFAIDAIHGKNISAFSANSDEQEIVLMPGARVRARSPSISFNDRLFILHLEEINLQSESQSEANCLFEQIKQKYQRNSRIERFMNPSRSFPVEHSYINLAVVNAKEQQEKEKQLCGAQSGDAIMSSFEEIYDIKTTTDLKDIFKTCKNPEKQVLVFGRAGIGKSTFCRYVAHQWAMGSFCSQYELLALIPLRRLTADRYPTDKSYSLIDLVKKEVFPYELSKKDENRLEQQFDAKKTLWILDGYDEIVRNVPPHLESLLEQLLQTPHHILTSRPYLITLSYDVQMEITGFTDDNIQKYVQQFFNQMKDELDETSIKSQSLRTFLRSNPSVWGVAHIPINLELICSLWSNEDWSETEQLTITTLYTMITEWLCRRYLRSPDNQILQLSDEETDQRCQKELAFLESLAFHAMENNTIIIQPSLLKKALEEAKVSAQEYPHLLRIGILKSLNKRGTGSQIEMEKDHYFVHLSFQEYFAARYLFKALKESATGKATDLIKRQKYNQRFALVFSFASGLYSESDQDSCSNIFWDTILAEPLDLVGIRHMQLVISCLEETSGKITSPRHTKLLEWIAECIKYNCSSRSESISGYLSQSLRRAQSVSCDPIIIRLFINLLQCEDADTKVDVLSFISELQLLNPSTPLITLMTTILNHRYERVRSKACWALGVMGEKAATDEVISQLVSALRGWSDDVRMYACEALGKMGEKAATNEIISQIVSALGNKSEDVRKYAYLALGKMGEKVETTEVISQLVSALGNQRDDVRRYACLALGKMGEKAATNEVISRLVSALGDQSEYVRINACLALGEMGEKAATNEVISQLGSRLEDQRVYVRINACLTLGKMGEKTATKEVINQLVRALGNQSEDVRTYAYEALGKMNEKAATNEVISQLVCVLEDESKYVRRDACKAVGKLGEKAATNEVISQLVSLLGDLSEDVRKYACEALGNMGEKAATNEVISQLVSALRDQNESVRIYACEALGKIDEKAATNEVISQLVNALEDQSEYVRKYACDALEKMGEKAATNEVISRLVIALGDQTEYVCRSACLALGKMGEKAATNEVISHLVSALGDQRKWVRKYACNALGNMGGKAATNEAINHLLSALGDQSDDVRMSACFALGKMGEKAATNEVISKLVTTPGNLSGSVRGAACFALGKMGEKAATSEVINELLSALADWRPSVRMDACFALGKMGEKAATNEVISKLLGVLNRNGFDVAANAISSLLNSSAVLAQLNPGIVSNLRLSPGTEKILKNISVHQSINSLFITKNPNWLPFLTRFALYKGVAIAVVEDKVVVYDRNEPSEVPFRWEALRQQVIRAFNDQARQLHLSF